MKFLVVLTQYKRSHLKNQLDAISKQTLKPDHLIVFQNENHVDITPLKLKYNFIHIKSDYNTKFFGRFAACLTFDVDLCIVMDDDIIPGKNCLQNYTSECIRMNSIMGGNGRIAQINPNKGLCVPPDTGIVNETTLVDFVGHLWCFKKDWLYYMFSIKPSTYDTGEDMHLCFSSKIKGSVKSYVCKRPRVEDSCDTSLNKYAVDSYSSYRTTSRDLRKSVEKYFVDNYKITFILPNER